MVDNPLGGDFLTPMTLTGDLNKKRRSFCHLKYYGILVKPIPYTQN